MLSVPFISRWGAPHSLIFPAPKRASIAVEECMLTDSNSLLFLMIQVNPRRISSTCPHRRSVRALHHPYRGSRERR